MPKWRNWQTRMIQVHVSERMWKFESSLRHSPHHVGGARSNLIGQICLLSIRLMYSHGTQEKIQHEVRFFQP